MSRVKRGVTKNARKTKIFARVVGFRGRRKNTIRIASQAADKSGQHAYIGRKLRKRQYAEVTDLPLEVVYDAREMPAALQRLEQCEVVIVDTPGRSQRAKDANQQWQAMFRAAAPDEVHLVVPASMRPDLLPSLTSALAACRITHACLTKVDELHDDRAIADLATRLTWPMRWVTTGQSVPHDLHPAKAAILGALGLPGIGKRGAAA